jgi:hypothetical protein
VVPTPGSRVPYALIGPDAAPVEPVQDYLTELAAANCSRLMLRSYAFDLLDWLRFLAAAGIGWQRATRAHVREWVLCLRGRPTRSAPVAEATGYCPGAALRVPAGPRGGMATRRHYQPPPVGRDRLLPALRSPGQRAGDQPCAR